MNCFQRPPQLGSNLNFAENGAGELSSPRPRHDTTVASPSFAVVSSDDKEGSCRLKVRFGAVGREIGTQRFGSLHDEGTKLRKF